MEDTNQELMVQIITQHLAHNYPYFVDLEELVRNLQDGQVQVTLRVFKGKVTDMVTNEVKRKVYK